MNYILADKKTLIRQKTLLKNMFIPFQLMLITHP